MAMILFYGPIGVHERLCLDKDITFFSSCDELRDSIINSNGIQYVLCICGPDKSEVINEVQKHQHVKAIYCCAEHGPSYDNSAIGPKYRGNLNIEQYSGWELTCRLTALEICIPNGLEKRALMCQLEKLREIERWILPRLRSSAKTAKLQANQSNGSNMDLASEETTESSCS